MENKHTKEDLKTMQAWPLERKIQVTQTRIMEWYMKWEGKVFVAFSGGKDSTVLLDLARRVYPDIPAVFCDTGLEYPEIREFVRTKENVVWLYPVQYDKKKREWVKTSFKSVIETYGYPVISKEVSRQVHDVKIHGDNCFAAKFFTGERGQFDMSKHKYLIDAPFEISNKCCDVMKKAPVHVFEKESGRKPIVGTMACESRMRRSHWLKYGCNSFNGKTISKPMSFWTEQDVLLYLKRYEVPFASIYGEIKDDAQGKLHTTKAQRTGCMFCMFGVHLEKEPNRFQRMKETHPKQYTYCINTLGIGEVLDYIGVPYN